MKIILTQDLKTVGFKDDVVTVKNGYAANYLIPRGYAIMATESNLKSLTETLKQTSRKQEKVKQDALKLAEDLNGATLTIGAKAGANGKIFGSITALQVSQALKNKGFEVDRRRIDFDQDIKALGTYTATITLHKEAQVKVNVEVISE